MEHSSIAYEVMEEAFPLFDQSIPFRQTNPPVNHQEEQYSNDYQGENDYDVIYDEHDEAEEDDEEEEYPCVLYNLKTAPVPDNSKELMERQEKIKQKKQEEQKAQQVLHIASELPDEALALKKLKKIAPFATDVKGCCYIPERNLLVITVNSGRKALFYSTLSFQAVACKNFAKPLRVVRFSREFERVFFGGEDFYVETYNINTFRTEAESLKDPGHYVDEIKFLKKNNAIAVGLYGGTVCLLSKGLLELYRICCNNYPYIKEIISLNNDCLLVGADEGSQKALFSLNLKTRRAIKTDNIYVSFNSCIEVTKKTPFKAVTCLATIPGMPTSCYGRYLLSQFTLDDKTDKMVVHKVFPKTREFITLKKIQNSDRFVAQFYEGSSSKLKVSLMKISGDDCQLINMIMNPDCNIVYADKFAVLRQPSLMVGVDARGSVCVYSVKDKDQENQETTKK